MCQNLHWHDEQSSHVRYSNSCQEFRPTKCSVPLRIDRAMLLKWNSRYLSSFAEKTGDHFLRSAFSTNIFSWIWLVLEGPHGGLWFFFGLICIAPWLVTCYDLMNVFWGNAIVFLQHFYAPIDKRLFWAIAGFNENQSFLRSVVHAIWNVCCWQKCPRIMLSHGMSHDNLASSVHARHQCSLAQQSF